MVDRLGRDDGSEESAAGATDAGRDGSGGGTTGDPPCVACTEAYEQDGVVVLFDAENPLAWIEADSTVQVQRMA